MNFNYSLVLLMYPSIIFSNWQELLETYRPCMSTETYMLLARQENDFRTGKAPIVAHPTVKSMEIKECGESVIDVRNTNHSRVKTMEGEELIKAYGCKENVEERSEGYAILRKTVFAKLARMVEELDRLAPEFGYEAGELEIRLFEGLRDLATQKKLFDMVMSNISQKNPGMTQEEAHLETSKWVSPYVNNVPTHSTGAAIDIHLWSNKTNTFCDMGPYNTSGSKSPTFSNDPELTEQQKKNRLLFVIAATEAGLTNYVYEFWHYSYGDRYASYWREEQENKRVAIYNAL